MAEVRILSHMNKDHSLSIEDYLVVYGKVHIGQKISNIKMTEITKEHMTISFKHEDIEFDVTKIIPFEPPLEDLSQARVKLVEMAKFAATERGLAHFQIKGYKYPGLLGWLLIALIETPLVVYFFPWVLEFGIFTNYLPQSFISLLQRQAFNIFLFATFTHILEAYFVLEPLLEKYRVPTEYKIEWYISVLIEGYPPIKRLNSLIAEHQH